MWNAVLWCIYICVCIYVYAYVYVCMHMYMYIYIQLESAYVAVLSRSFAVMTRETWQTVGQCWASRSEGTGELDWWCGMDWDGLDVAIAKALCWMSVGQSRLAS